jgi:hypothetical protein
MKEKLAYGPPRTIAQCFFNGTYRRSTPFPWSLHYRPRAKAIAAEEDLKDSRDERPV